MTLFCLRRRTTNLGREPRARVSHKAFIELIVGANPRVSHSIAMRVGSISLSIALTISFVVSVVLLVAATILGGACHCIRPNGVLFPYTTFFMGSNCGKYLAPYYASPISLLRNCDCGCRNLAPEACGLRSNFGRKLNCRRCGAQFYWSVTHFQRAEEIAGREPRSRFRMKLF